MSGISKDLAKVEGASKVEGEQRAPSNFEFFGVEDDRKLLRPSSETFDSFDLIGNRGGGIRTPDPLVPNQMRYQAALRPDCL